MTVLHLEPFGGMAGDMFLAALLDLERDAFALEDLHELADALVPGECHLAVEEVVRGSLRGKLLRVTTPESIRSPHRRLADLLQLLERAPLGREARTRGANVLERIARAEARVHGVTVEAVHFHEVGAVDTLIDVCGACLGLERLGVERVVSSVPYVGGGSVSCAHGEMPVPAPGTAELLRGVPRRQGPGGERVTPTGAALLAELVDEFEPAEPLTAGAVGYGAGTRDVGDGPPNLLRVSLCTAGSEAPVPGPDDRRWAWLLECNLDDATGEEVGFLLQELRSAGALEAWSTPVQMKKDRPGAIVSALCREPIREELESLCFAHSPTLGVRWSRCERTECERETILVPFEGREVRVQVRHRPGRPSPSPGDVAPEYDDLAALARSTGRPLRAVEQDVRRAACERLDLA